MTAPVTSKYETVFWIKLFGFPALGIMAIVLLFNESFDDDPNRYRNLIIGFVLVIGFIGRYIYKHLSSPPEKITVTKEDITIYQYLLKNTIVLKYSDIDKTRTVRSSSANNGSVFSQLSNYQILEIELNDGKIYQIHEGDFQNYSELKSAIYDHLFRHQ